MSGKHVRREPGLTTGELELRFPAHRRPDDETVDPRADECEPQPHESNAD